MVLWGPPGKSEKTVNCTGLRRGVVLITGPFFPSKEHRPLQRSLGPSSPSTSGSAWVTFLHNPVYSARSLFTHLQCSPFVFTLGIEWLFLKHVKILGFIHVQSMYYVCIILLLLLRLNAVKNLFYCTECFLLPLGENLIIVPKNYGQIV